MASRTLGAPQPANQGDPKRFFHGLFSKLPNSRAWAVGAFDCGRRTGWKTADRRGILAGWPVAFGRPNISTAPIAGWLTLRQRKRIQTSIPAVSTVKSVISRSMHGRALMTSSVGRSIKRTRPSLGKRNKSVPNALGTPKLAKSIIAVLWQDNCLEPGSRRRIFVECPSSDQLSWHGKIPGLAGASIFYGPMAKRK